MAIEEHGAGRQLLRVRSSPRISLFGVLLAILLGLLAVAAAFDAAWGATAILALFALLLTSQTLVESASAVAVLRAAVRRVGYAASAQDVREPAGEGFVTGETLEPIGVQAAD